MRLRRREVSRLRGGGDVGLDGRVEEGLSDLLGAVLRGADDGNLLDRRGRRGERLLLRRERKDESRIVQTRDGPRRRVRLDRPKQASGLTPR